MLRRVAPALGLVVGALIPACLKLHDVRAVRVAVPDLGYWESITWPLYEVSDGLRAGYVSPDEAREWVRLMRAGEEIPWTYLDG